MDSAAGPPGRRISPWRDLARPERAPLDRDLSVDVAVVGGGIVGLTTALMAQRGGARVAVLEGRQIGDGTTGNTTAKLTSLHGLTYASLASRHGAEVAEVYAETNEAGIGEVARLVDELGIDCDLRRKPNLTYVESEAERGEIEAEVEAADAAGLHARLLEGTDLPYEVAAAIEVSDQAEFHPVRYLLGLADELDRDGQRIHERTRVTGLDGARLLTESGWSVSAERIVLATQLPILDGGLHFARAHPERSHSIGVRLAAAPPAAMYISADGPTRSLRAYRWEGEELLIVAGESARPGSGGETDRFRALEHWTRERFEVESVEHRWAAHDLIPEDGLPYIGRLRPWSDRVLTATGMRKWGLAMGTAAGTMLADATLGASDPWPEPFDSTRLPRPHSLPSLVSHNAASAVHFFGDRVRRRERADELGPGEGRVAGTGLAQRALFRDERGTLHAMTARCTHLGCIVAWNDAERTWDCPCHGSRFGPTGEVLAGPARRPLGRREAP